MAERRIGMPVITVSVVDLRKAKGTYVVRWRNETTGEKGQRTARTTKRRDAERFAVRLQSQLEHDEAPTVPPWREVRERYERERLIQCRKSHRDGWRTAANAFERIVKPKTLLDLNADTVSRFGARLAAEHKALSSQKSYLIRLRACANWAKRIYRGYRPPEFHLPRVPKGEAAGGRAITAEEFDRLVAAVPKALRPRAKQVKGVPARAWIPEGCVASWKRLLEGLYLSGLRLGESLDLWWDNPDEMHIAWLDHARKKPMLRIRAEDEKGNRYRELPITPDFAEFLRKTPRSARHGRVFQPSLDKGPVRSTITASAVICAIGEAADIKVGTRKKKQKETGLVETVPRFASAQDLRRAFGVRWAAKVMPPDLMILMRHEDISTTMKFYVGRNAQRTADEVWDAFARTSDSGREKVTY